MAVKNQTLTQQNWPQAEFSKTAGTLLTALIPVLVYSIVQLIRLGSSGNHYVLMIIGSVLSAIGVFAYIMASFVYGAANKKSFIAVLLTFLGFIPYVFGCYLTFYQGFWGFAELKHGFSVWAIVKAVVCIVLGFIVVNKTYQITELDKKVEASAKAEAGTAE